MKGFMRQRGSAWDLRVYLGKDPVSGKQRYVPKTVRGGNREAQRVLNAMVVDAERGLAYLPPSIPLPVRPSRVARLLGRRSSRPVGLDRPNVGVETDRLDSS